jgi:c-di-GMP-binding flagellar brake protein YcgR
MNGNDKRRYRRVDSTNLLNYVCLNENSEPFTQGMGRTLNVSESGILLETHTPIDPETMVSLTIGIEEDLVEITGKVVYLKESGEDTYEAGINFSAFNEIELNILKKFIAAFERE